MNDSIRSNNQRDTSYTFPAAEAKISGPLEKMGGIITNTALNVLLHVATGGVATIARVHSEISNLQSLQKTSKDLNESTTNILSGMMKTAKAREKSDKELNETPQARHDPEKMMAYLCNRHGKTAVIEVLAYLKANDSRFNTNDERFAFDSKELSDALSKIPSNQKGSKTTFPDLASDAEDADNNEPLNHSSAVVQDIAAELVAFVERKPVKVESTNGTLLQTYGHVTQDKEGKSQVSLGKTPSAELPNKKKIGNVVNQASILFTAKTGDTKKVLMCRSGRTDSKEKIRDKSIGDIIARFDANDPCLKKNGDYYEYRRVDNTLMDSSILKSTFTLVKGFLKNKGTEKPLESERMFIDNKKKAMGEMWDLNHGAKEDNNGVFIEHHIIHKGKEITVREYKPVINEYVFSGQSKQVGNLKAARMANRDSTLQMGLLLAQQLVPKDRDMMMKFADYQDSPHSPSKNKALTEVIEKKINSVTDPSQKIALEGIYASLTGKIYGTEVSIDTVLGAAQQYLYAAALADLVNCAWGAECKSGNDRTATAVAAKCAMEEYNQLHPGAPLDPKGIGSSEEFKKLFIKYTIELGVPNVAASRGVEAINGNKPILKTAGHPIFNSLAKDNQDQWIKVAIPGKNKERSIDEFATLV